MPKIDSLNVLKVPHYYGHRRRLRQRFLLDPIALPDYEILELLLYWVFPRKDVKPEAKTLIQEMGSLGCVMGTVTLQSHPGLFFALQLIQEISRRILLEDLKKGPILNNSEKVIEYCRLMMMHLSVEQFRLFFLDRKYHLIQDEIQQWGTLDQVPLYPREVLRRALELNASNLILVHNHPSGDPKPSSADIELTRHLQISLFPFTIRVLDHFIVGKNGYFSFREHSLLMEKR